MNLEILVYDGITAETARATTETLARQPSAPVTVRVNSYGGDLAAGLAMLNALRAHRGRVRIEVEGIAASSATLLLCAGFARMAENAALMVHAPWMSEISGNARDLRNAASGLDAMSQGMIAAYRAKTGKPAAEIAALLDGSDHWFTPAEALAFGLIDEITAGLRIAARLGPLQPPAKCRPTMTQSAESPTSAEVIQIQDAAAREALAAEQNRRRDIKNLLHGPLARRKDLVEVMNACLDDMTVTADEASARLLRKAGEGLESIGGHGAVAHGASSIGGSGAVGNSVAGPHGALAREFRAVERGPVGFGGFGSREFVRAASDALAIRFGAPLKNPHPAAQDLRETSLLGMASLVLSQAGTNPVGLSRSALVKAAMTTSDFPELMSVAANKTLGARFEAITLEHRAIAEKADLVDFKPAKVINTSLLPGLVFKPEAGEIEYGSITDGSTTYKLLTYARGLAFSRELMVNDDLDAIGLLLRNAATSGARLERDLIFETLTGNPAMGDGAPLFHATHGNLDTTGAALDIAGLNKARVLMRKQKDSSGAYVLTAPRYLVVPVAVEADAEALVASLTYKAGTDVERETPAWVRGLTIISDPRLDDSDPADWYLLSDPLVSPTLRLGYLNGRDTPEVEQDADFNTDVLRFKIRFDVASAAAGWSGAVKMA